MSWPAATMILAGLASVANLLLLRLPRNPRLYPYEKAYLVWHATLAAGSAFYAVAFGLLVFTDVDRATWSEALTPVAAMTFFLVWTVPALLYRLAHGTLRRNEE